MESAENKLAGPLMNVALGIVPEVCLGIQDHDMSRIPMLPSTHSGYERRVELRNNYLRENGQFAAKRQQIILHYWTELYKALADATEVSAPFLHSKLKKLCDMSITHSMPGSHKDGPRAWKMVVQAMVGRDRSEADKDFYRKAERFQRDHRLPDGCGPDEYSNKALAYLTKLMPHLPNEPTKG